jgi:acetylornithine/succinyldiaminopimelate/putrescine aminotransferase
MKNRLSSDRIKSVMIVDFVCTELGRTGILFLFDVPGFAGVIVCLSITD